MASDRQHAVLAASGAHRWIHCNPSARFEEKLEAEYGDGRSAESEEGTRAHKLAELKLRQMFNQFTPEYPGVLECTTAIQELNPDKDMIDNVDAFCDYVMNLWLERKKVHANVVVYVEQRLDYSQWAPEGFGTGDVVMVCDEDLDVIDLKYGEGVKVSPKNNPQTRLYGLGAWVENSIIYDIKRVTTHIFQPRVFGDVEEPETLTVDELLEWGETIVAPAAVKAFNGEGTFVPGEHCKFCKARSVCRVNAAYNMQVFSNMTTEQASLTEDELSAILMAAERASAWLSNLKKFVLAGVMSGKLPMKDWKVVAGTSRRKIMNHAEAIAKLKEKGLYKDGLIELIGITELEKQLGKKAFAEALGEYVFKPEGAPTLVPVTDKREALTVKESDYFPEESKED